LVRELIRAAALAGLVSAFLLASCTGSDDIGFRRTGAGGDTGSGEAGNGSGDAGSGSGAAGSAAPGAAGSNETGAGGSAIAGTAGKTGSSGAGAGSGTSGAAGASGTAGSPSGTGGSSSGAAGSSSGAAGSKGSAGTSGSAGATGAAGSTSSGAAGAAAAGSMIDPGIGCGQTKVYSYSGGIENLLIQNCGGCHYAAPGVNVQGGFSFSYANVTGVTNGHPSCVGLDASKRRVVPGKPDNSLLWIKAYDDSPPAGCGGHMPFQGSRLTMSNLCYIRAWITAGAPP
jgi:hypothetical protein